MSGLISSTGAREKARGRGVSPGLHLVPQLKRQLPEIGTVGHARGDAVVGEPVHMVEDVLARVVLRPAGQVMHVPDVGVGIDQRGNDRLPFQVDTRGARRELQVAPPAHPCEPVVLDDECGVLYGRTAVARDEPRAFEHRNPGRSGCLACHLGGAARRQEQTPHEERIRRHFHSVHGSLAGSKVLEK